MKTKGLIAAVLLTLSLQAQADEISCTTSIDDLVNASGSLEDIDPNDLRDWIVALQDDDCAALVIAGYPEIDAVVDDYRPGANLDEIELVNKGGAFLEALKTVLLEEDFYGDLESRILNQLPDQLRISTVPRIVFRISPVRMDGNAILSVGAVEDQLIAYRSACVTLDSDSCREWERSLRFFAAMTYAVEDIAESQSLIIATRVQESVEQYIEDWDEYFDQRKPQLPWELLANEIWNRDIRTSKYFPQPPKSDLVILHPQLVYTDFDSFDNEVEIESTLLWELVGYNRWDNSFITGISIASTKLDSAEDLGILLTIRNIFAIGVIERDDDETAFVSVDLFDFIVNKKNEFREKLDANLAEFKDQGS